MSSILAFIDGKKTYITMLLTFVAAGLTACGYTIPEWAWIVLGGLGLGTIRSAIKKGEVPKDEDA